MGYVEPNPQRIQDFLAEGDADAPIVMINLLRYRNQAAYPDGSDAVPCSGRDAYGRYGVEAVKHVAAAGGHMLWLGEARFTLIGPDDEQWDDAVLVEYPTKKAFLEMVMKPEYQAIAIHRTAALDDSRLICTTTQANLLGD
jgi:uncharacterized protein (DUF1330 family)